MRSRANTVSFVLFVVVLLAAVFWLLHQHGRTNRGLVTVLLGVLVLRAALFAVNLHQQRQNAERGRGQVKIETRLGLNDEPSAPDRATDPAAAPLPTAPGDAETRRQP